MPHPIIQILRRRLGDEGLLVPEDGIERYVEEPRRRWTARPVAVARPRSTAEVAWIVERCREHRLPLVTRGGGTGTVGGAAVRSDNGELLLSLDRMRAVRVLDPAAATLTAEAGLALDAARAAAHAHDLEVPLWLASGGSATLGGIVATNAGGNTTIRHGNARRMVLGVEAVLADGRVLDLLSGLRKDNTGYDLTGLLVGSEGTLGILTAVTLALVPRPAQRATAWCALDSPAAALELLARCRRHLGETLTAFELVPRFALELVLAHRLAGVAGGRQRHCRRLAGRRGRRPAGRGRGGRRNRAGRAGPLRCRGPGAVGAA
jgi:FAD/FMN-containing dehydrogenase